MAQPLRKLGAENNWQEIKKDQKRYSLISPEDRPNNGDSPVKNCGQKL